LKEWTTPDSRKTPSTTNLEEEEIEDAPGNDGNASMPEQAKRLNPWRKMMMMIKIQTINILLDLNRHAGSNTANPTRIVLCFLPQLLLLLFDVKL